MTATDDNAASRNNSVALTDDTRGLDPDAQTVLEYVRRHEPVTRSEVRSQTGLPVQRLDRILASLERLAFVDVHQGFSTTTISAIYPRGEL